MEILNQRPLARGSRCSAKLFSGSFFFLALLFCAGELWGQTVSKEYRVKAAFLYNFASFVTWPPEIFPDKTSPLVIGIVGDDPFGQVLDEIVENEKASGHPIVVKRFREEEEVKDCHILFISQSETRRMEQILTAQKGRSVLTVSDAEKFADKGGLVQFTTERDKIRLRINAEAAKKVNLTISSRLLRLAELVSSKTE